MIKFYLIRHGETDWNNKKILMGQTDIPLNSLGEKQVEVLASYIKNLDIDIIYTSDLSRARSTAEAIAKKSGKQYIPDERLRECSAGNLEGLTFPEMIELFPDEINLYRLDEISYLPPEGESRIEFIKRVSTFIESLIGKHHNENLALVTHGGVIRALLSYILSNDFKITSPKFSQLFRVDNCSISLITYNKQWEISYLNDIHYLNDCK